MMSSKLTSEHLARKAIVYVRQSTAAQVRENLESQRRQYALVEHARSLGFGDVELIDQDLGHSGSTLAGRMGFQRLVAQVSLGVVGAVLSLEASVWPATTATGITWSICAAWRERCSSIPRASTIRARATTGCCSDSKAR